ncbi:uncharacterized protein SCHCODRAFT_01185249 [Schizophyllum commune H4-8]|nr:uncharacterized protein SCHCODRAFT_01185249 [Schizophyllum commune H4-8]KAI5894079.1 hypothetical protein SCHCODRAFT_01185249 [Schizophyllum commune H4-8]
MPAVDASENAGPSLFPLGAGPPLPDFSSLLVHGAYHPSAPLHLCFSASRISAPGSSTSELPDLVADAPVLLVTANRDALKDGLRAGGWQRTGRSMHAAKQVQVLAPPTAVHAELLLSLLRIWTPGCETTRPVLRKPKTSDASTSGEPRATAAGALASDDASIANARVLAPKPATSNTMRANILPECPALIVLHEPSAYFVQSESEDDEDGATPTMSSYIALVSRLLRAAVKIYLSTYTCFRHADHTIATLVRLLDIALHVYQLSATSNGITATVRPTRAGRPPVPVALFDRGSHTLRLPLSRPPMFPREGAVEHEGEDRVQSAAEVSEFVRALFQWEAFIEDGEPKLTTASSDDTVVPSSQDQELHEDHGTPRRLTLRTASAERTLLFRERGRTFIWDS